MPLAWLLLTAHRCRKMHHICALLFSGKLLKARGMGDEVFVGFIHTHNLDRMHLCSSWCFCRIVVCGCVDTYVQPLAIRYTCWNQSYQKRNLLPFSVYVFMSPGSFRQEIVLGDSCA